MVKLSRPYGNGLKPFRIGPVSPGPGCAATPPPCSGDLATNLARNREPGRERLIDPIPTPVIRAGSRKGRGAAQPCHDVAFFADVRGARRHSGRGVTWSWGGSA
ncbi:hypothetical protein GCM10027074_59080 [Streptomyces deserti]